MSQNQFDNPGYEPARHLPYSCTPILFAILWAVSVCLGACTGGDSGDPMDVDPCDVDEDTFENLSCGGTDCNDEDSLIHPDADEKCDDVDHNCDGSIQSGAIDPNTYYKDEDQDGFGDPNSSTEACGASWPYVSDSTDCNDSDPLIHPDHIWYRDADADFLGNPLDTLASCEQPDGYVDNGQDPDDTDGAGIGCWKQVVVGRDFSCGLHLDGTVACWGSNADGQLDVPPTLGEVDALSAGYRHVCAKQVDGQVECWGTSANGASTAPTDTFTKISCGLNFCCGLTTDTSNNAICWGQNDQEQSNAPQGLFSDMSAGGGKHACAIDSNAEVICWGVQEGLQNGPNPTEAPAGTYASVNVGHYFSCAIDSLGAPSCFGADSYGQSSPPENTTFLSIVPGTVHACGIASDESIYCWGSDSFSRLDDPIGNFLQLDTNQLHSCAITTDYVATCWGYNEFNKTTPANCISN
jgi:hypothetical protein